MNKKILNIIQFIFIKLLVSMHHICFFFMKKDYKTYFFANFLSKDKKLAKKGKKTGLAF